MIIAWTCVTDEENRSALRIALWKTEGKRPLGRFGPRYIYSVESDRNRMGRLGLD